MRHITLRDGTEVELTPMPNGAMNASVRGGPLTNAQWYELTFDSRHVQPAGAKEAPESPVVPARGITTPPGP